MKNLLFLFMGIFLFASCGNDDDLLEDINVKLSIVLDGEVSDSPTITYNDENEKEIELTLSDSWEKEFTVKEGYKMYIKVAGKLKGKLDLKVVGTGPSISYDKVIKVDNPEEKKFDIKVEDTLK